VSLSITPTAVRQPLLQEEQGLRVAVIAIAIITLAEPRALDARGSPQSARGPGGVSLPVPPSAFPPVLADSKARPA
jgi:hypothetical protein